MATPIASSDDWIDRAIKSSLNDQDQVLRQEIADARDQVNRALGKDKKLQPLAEILSKFTQFSTDYLNFYYDNPDISKRQKAIENIQHEWLTLRSLLEQRQSDHLLDSLNIADTIANDCVKISSVKPATFKKPCLTLFEDTYRITRFVYSDVPNIAVPLSYQEAPWFWLGIAHEIGHYHFGGSRGELNNELDRVLLQSISKWAQDQQQNNASAVHQLALWHEWKEELFADLFGALILGPAYVHSLMIWLGLRVNAQTMAVNDHDHPPSLLRPLIQAEALQALEKRADKTFNNASGQREVDQVKQTWQKRCMKLSPDGTFDYWLNQPIGESVMRDCATLIPAIVGALAETVFDGRVSYYSADTHAEVIRIAMALAKGDALTTTLSPAMAMPVAWYTWKEVISDGTLDNSRRQQRLAEIKKWVADQTSAFFVESALRLSETKLPEANRFQKRKKELEAENPKAAPDEIADRLLEYGFSTEEEAGGPQKLLVKLYTDHPDSTHYHLA